MDTNLEHCERDKNKKFSMKKSISHVNCNRSKTKQELFEESFNRDFIQTNLERMINNLNSIKKKLLLIQDIHLAGQIDWMVDTLLKNQLNDVIVKIENDNNTNSSDIEKMLELLAEFSSELNFKRNIEKLQSTFIQKKQSILLNPDVNEVFNLQSKILVKDFDIFKLAEECDRENVLLVVTGNLFNHFSLFNKIEKDTFASFIEEIKNGYKRSNPYHNVNKILFRTYMLLM
jgi:hypothetical protein